MLLGVELLDDYPLHDIFVCDKNDDNDDDVTGSVSLHNQLIS